MDLNFTTGAKASEYSKPSNQVEGLDNCEHPSATDRALYLVPRFQSGFGSYLNFSTHFLDITVLSCGCGSCFHVLLSIKYSYYNFISYVYFHISRLFIASLWQFGSPCLYDTNSKAEFIQYGGRRTLLDRLGNWVSSLFSASNSSLLM